MESVKENKRKEESLKPPVKVTGKNPEVKKRIDLLGSEVDLSGMTSVHQEMVEEQQREISRLEH